MCQEARQSARDALSALAEMEGQAELEHEELKVRSSRYPPLITHTGSSTHISLLAPSRRCGSASTACARTTSA